MNAFRFFQFITGLFLPSFFPTRNRLLKNGSFFKDVFWMACLFKINSTSFVESLTRIPVLTFLDNVGLFPEMVPKWRLFLDQTSILKFRRWLSIFSSVLQNNEAFLLKENCWFSFFKISFASMGVYPLTGVMELFQVTFDLKVVEEQFPWYRFLACCVFLTEECFCWRKLSFYCIFLPWNLLFLYPWLPPLCR